MQVMMLHPASAPSIQNDSAV